VAVTLGSEGALLVNRDGANWMPAIEVDTRSAVGAGDSFVAAMTYGFATGLNAQAALRLGMAAGAATALTPGTDLCHPADVRRLLGEVKTA
jgi:6-phosphofructokinase 2